MPKPRIFISSTYSDLQDIRSQISSFITNYGYTPAAFEKGDITYQIDTKLEDSCYDEIKECSLFILLIKNNYGSTSKSIIVNPEQKNKSITQTEYNIAKSLGIPIFVFIYQSSLNEYDSFVNQDMPKDYKFNHLENIHLARFIHDIYKDKSSIYIHKFTTHEEIESVLRDQWAGLFNKYLKTAKKYTLRKNKLVKVNSFKLFYFRRHKGLSQLQLSKRTGIPQNIIIKIEDAGVKKNHIELHDFESVQLEKLQRIADALDCSVGNLKAGLPDDFLSQYLLYYFKNKGTTQRRKKGSSPGSVFKTKAIVFDFDGTLTQPTGNLTTWEKIWTELGYSINECASLHRKYSISEITHKDWCLLTQKNFTNKKLSKNHLDKIADELFLVEGIEDVIQELVENGVILYICSGSIDYIIKRSLGKLYSSFEGIKSNKFTFEKNGLLKAIIGTKYDFEGKSDYISQIAKENDINPFEILYVGNSLNDEWAHQSGALTLCVNPSMTNPDHPLYWTYSIKDLKNLKEIFTYVNYK